MGRLSSAGGPGASARRGSGTSTFRSASTLYQCVGTWSFSRLNTVLRASIGAHHLTDHLDEAADVLQVGVHDVLVVDLDVELPFEGHQELKERQRVHPDDRRVEGR